MSRTFLRWLSPLSHRRPSPPLLGLPIKAAAAGVRRLGRDDGGAVALLAALTLTLICGVVGLAIDVSVWYRTTRAMQNAADAAAVAAARDGGTSFDGTGKAVAARYGFIDSVGGISVQITKNAPCPSGGNGCFQATIDDAAAPQFFSKVLDLTAPRLSASATAGFTGPTNREYCIIALATSGADPAIRTNGAPFADLNHCNVLSNTGMTCHGHELNADSADAVLYNHGCGNGLIAPRPISDPLSSLAANIPPSLNAPLARPASAACGATQWCGALNLRDTQTISGDLVLGGSGPVQVTTAASGSVVYIQNGTLNLNGRKLQEVSGGGLTFVFTGPNGVSTSPAPYPTGGGTLDFYAPTSGPWAGVAVYIDPRTPPQTINLHGNSPTWNITGTVYMPHANLTVSGAVGKSSNGGACFALIVDSLRINGTGQILVRPDDCASAGVTLPTNRVPSGSPALVL
jgi:hypothetical protein